MVVECPKCRTTYNFDDNVAKPGQKLRCSVCEHIFALPSTSPSPEESEADVTSGQDLADLEDELLPSDAAEDSASKSDAGGLSFDLDDSSSKKKEKTGKGKMIAIALTVVALLIGFGIGGVYFLAPGLLSDGGNASSNASVGGEMDSAAMEEMVKHISLESIRQYYVANEKAGKIFVIEGRAVNGSDAPKELVEVEASLFDDNNQELDSHRLLCGNTLSLFQLQVLEQSEIEKALKDEAGIGANNVNLQPSQEVPFMIVFFEPSEAVAEFVVKVVSVRDVGDI